MAENPYKSPQVEPHQAGSPLSHPLAPAWRRILSLPLLILGGLGLFFELIDLSNERIRRMIIEAGPSRFILATIVCIAMLGTGVLLRRRPWE